MSLKAGMQTDKSCELPKGWTCAKLGEIARINPTRSRLVDRGDNEPTSFIPMSAVNDTLGAITAPELRPFQTVKTGYTYFEEGDVLFAKITPCMQNGKHAIAKGLIDGFGFGSTEFHVVRPGPEISSEWIHFYLRLPENISDAESHFNGAVGQQRVPPEWLSNLEIPLPPLETQHIIAAHLSEQMAAVEQARKAAEEQLEAARKLTTAYLRSVFESEDVRQWPTKPLGQTGHIVSGITLGKKPNGQLTRSIPYLRVANVKDGYLDLSDIYSIEATEAEIEKLRLQAGDLLLTEGGDPDKLGRGTFWREEIPECIHQNHIFRVRFDLEQFSAEFLSAQISSPYGKTYFLAHAKQTTGIATINQEVLSNFPLMTPPVEIQRRVVNQLYEKITSVERIVKSLEEQLDAVNSLPPSLLRHAFIGGTAREQRLVS